MVTLLLCIIYLAFISVGLPDSLLGSAWPVMQRDLNVPLSAAGIVTMIISGGTVLSSLFTDRLVEKLGSGGVCALSTLLTALAMLGFSLAGEFWQLCLLAVPYGLGAGAIDATLNNYVALHYASRHMSWLHCFWGLGALISPYIMGAALTGSLGWSGGYLIVAVVQFALTACLFLSIPLWRKTAKATTEDDAAPAPKTGVLQAVKTKGVPFVLLAFFGYCAAEATAMLWSSSFLVNHRGVDENTAAFFASLFFIGITLGRFIGGFVTEKLGDKRLIRIGTGIALCGVLLTALPVKTDVLALGGLVVVGLGCAPIYPSVIHATPSNFGAENSASIIGVQMASAYVGTSFMPPLFGLLAQYVGAWLFPYFILFFFLLMTVCMEILNKTVAKKNEA